MHLHVAFITDAPNLSESSTSSKTRRNDDHDVGRRNRPLANIIQQHLLIWDAWLLHLKELQSSLFQIYKRSRILVKAVKGEPTLSTDADMTNATESVSLCMKQTNAQKIGNTYEIAPPGAAEIDNDNLLVELAFGIGGQQINRQMQVLLFCIVTSESIQNKRQYAR